MTKVKLQYAKFAMWDFGKLNNGLGSISVDKAFWDRYVKARYEFEILHDALIDKIPAKVRIK